jgi:hypothetical protein
MEPLTLRFRDGRVEGEGRDVIGEFTFHGTWSDQGQVRMTKAYHNRHSVHYVGQVSGEGAVVGQWSIPPLFSGPFVLMPLVENVAELPILEISAVPE